MPDDKPFSVCDDSCPVMGVCLKYRLKLEDLHKLEQLIQDYSENKSSYKFAAFVGNLVKKMRKTANG